MVINKQKMNFSANRRTDFKYSLWFPDTRDLELFEREINMFDKMLKNSNKHSFIEAKQTKWI